jgi:hypothetical protein
VHFVQGKAEGVTGVLAILQTFYREKLTELLRHEAGSRLVSQYDANNTYQYIVNREEVQLSWLSAAIAELGGAVDDAIPVPDRKAQGKGDQIAAAIVDEDIREAQAFVDRWRPRVEQMTHARHALMLKVILGETLEQKRFFEQALAGRTDLLGRRSEAAGARVGSVLPSRWVG